MSDINEIKSRLKSVRQTRQITNAMYLLSVSTLKRSLKAIEDAEKICGGLKDCLCDVFSYRESGKIIERYTAKKQSGVAVYAVLMSDRGLCGSYNNEIASFTSDILGENKDGDKLLYCFGKRGKQALKDKNLKPNETFALSERSSFTEAAKRIVKILKELFDEKKANEIFVIYFDHKLHKPICETLLPIDTVKRHDSPELMYFEPSFKETVEKLVCMYCESAVRKMIVHAFASENAKRMEAMRSSTENADEMISDLETELNMARQLLITNEITETAAAAENLNGC